MSVQALKNAVAARDDKAANFPAVLERFKGEIAKALPRHLNPDRMCRVALTAFRRTPKLAECDPRSVFAAVVQASQLGLEPDTLGRCYLVPYEQRKKINGEWQTVGVECQFIPGWKGLVELVNRTGLASVWTGAVFAGDDFDYALGDTPFVKHRPGEEDDVSKMLYAYAIGRAKGAEWPVIEVWTNARIVKHRDRYNKVGKRHYSFENWEMYARKVVLLQVLKYMPMSPEVATAVALNNAAEGGAQSLNLDDAINNTYAPPIEGEATREQGAEDAPTFAEIMRRINEATNEAQVDDGLVLIHPGLPEAERAELADAGRARKLELG